MIEDTTGIIIPNDAMCYPAVYDITQIFKGDVILSIHIPYKSNVAVIGKENTVCSRSISFCIIIKYRGPIMARVSGIHCNGNRIARSSMYADYGP
jgi:hypothetical protein